MLVKHLTRELVGWDDNITKLIVSQKGNNRVKFDAN